MSEDDKFNRAARGLDPNKKESWFDKYKKAAHEDPLQALYVTAFAATSALSIYMTLLRTVVPIVIGFKDGFKEK